MIPYSVLDLSPIRAGFTARDALQETLALAPHAEALGYTRYWLAEHHNMPGIASSATSVVIGQVLAATRSMRVGSGGVMLPNHTPLIIAEQFGTLATLYPDRVDLGLGRAPGTDMATMRALRRGMDGADHFPQDVVELLGFLGDAAPDQRVQAIPGAGTHVPIWILGSSLYGAQLAAQFGLPYAFASHFAPAALTEAAAIYRDRFQPSAFGTQPYFMLAANIFAADDAAQAIQLKSSMQQAFANLRLGRPGPMPAPVERIEDVLDPMSLAMVEQAMQVSVVGTPDVVRAGLADLIARYEPDEIILNGAIYDPAARRRSFTIAAEAMRDLASSSTAAE
ncbi:MAG: LLM class flavin-dependent oxidoreductase [Paracoccaceae bacterium]